jgi:hypothetical protein
MSEIKKAVEKVITRHGGLRAASRALGIQASYLCRLRHGSKSNPSDKILRKLGLTKSIEYEMVR